MEAFKFYFFSGTGNSRKVAMWFCDEMSKNEVNASLIDITKERETPSSPESGTSIGFISPTHGFNFPPLFIYYLLRFPRAKHKNNVLIMNTRAGMKLSKLFLPGFSGISMWFAAIVLLVKGYRIIGMRSIDLPSNWISLHPGLRAKIVTSMFDHYETVTRTLAHKVLQGKKIFRPLLWIGMPLDLVVTPIAAGYFFVGRFILAKTFIATQACDNCNVCINQCPIQAISMVHNRPYWSYHCESCMRCMNNCPKRAIETAHGLIFIALLIISGILGILFSYFPLQTWPILKSDSIIDQFAWFIIKSALLFALLLVVYRLVHFLKRYRWFDAVVEWTSLTKYSFWRRYKARRN